MRWGPLEAPSYNGANSSSSGSASAQRSVGLQWDNETDVAAYNRHRTQSHVPVVDPLEQQRVCDGLMRTLRRALVACGPVAPRADISSSSNVGSEAVDGAPTQVFVWDEQQKRTLLQACIATSKVDLYAEPHRADAAAAAQLCGRMLAASDTAAIALDDPLCESQWVPAGAPVKLGQYDVDGSAKHEEVQWRAKAAGLVSAVGASGDGTGSGAGAGGTPSRAANSLARLTAELNAAHRDRCWAAPLLCVVKDAVRSLVALPIPGWYELDETAQWLQRMGSAGFFSAAMASAAPSSSSSSSAPAASSASPPPRSSTTTQQYLYSVWAAPDGEYDPFFAVAALCEHSLALISVVMMLREVVPPQLLPYRALPLQLPVSSSPSVSSSAAAAASPLPLLRSQLRRMMFVKLKEAQLGWEDARRKRITGEGTIHLQYIGPYKQPPADVVPPRAVGKSPQPEHLFEVVQGFHLLEKDGVNDWTSHLGRLLAPADEAILYRANRAALPAAVGAAVGAAVAARDDNGSADEHEHPLAAVAAGTGAGAAGNSPPHSQISSLVIPPVFFFNDAYNHASKNSYAYGDFMQSCQMAQIVALDPPLREEQEEAVVPTVKHTVSLQIGWTASGFAPKPGSKFLLMKRQYDGTLGTSIPRLQQLCDAASSGAPHAQLLSSIFDPSCLLAFACQPLAFAGHVEMARQQLLNAAAGIPALQGFDLTESQLASLQNVVQHRLAVLWGPPGTGKTLFLAVAILLLIAGHARYGDDRAPVSAAPASSAAAYGSDSAPSSSASKRRQPGGLRILLSASTNAAIKCLLDRLRELRSALREAGFYPSWLSGLYIDQDKDAGTSKDVMAQIAAGRAAVVGGTVWQLAKWSPSKSQRLMQPSGYCQWDIIIFDEGSQLAAADAVITAQLLHPAARVLVAGDHEQLPVVIKGDYPLSSDDGVPVQGSILHCVRGAIAAAERLAGGAAGAAGGVANGPGHSALVSELLESFRLNSNLCNLASQLYGETFTSHASAAGRRLRQAAVVHPHQGGDISQRASFHFGRLPAQIAATAADVAASLFSPTTSRVVVNLLPRPANAAAAAADAAGDVSDDEFATAVACAMVLLLLHQCSTTEGGEPLQPRDVFVPTPHRRQRAAVQEALQACRIPVSEDGADANCVRVDTVERLQGLEAEAVVICYGFSGPALTAQDASGFLYNSNRLNVSASRARCAAILLATEQLFDPPLETSLDAQRRKAVHYLKAFRHGADVHTVAWAQE